MNEVGTATALGCENVHVKGGDRSPVVSTDPLFG